MKLFPAALLERIFTGIDQLAEAYKVNRIAAFDADGTLWSIDIGEQFFKYQIESGQLKGLPPDPWNHYHNMKVEKSPQAAYLWLAQINQAQSIEQVRAWSKESLSKNGPVPVFDFQKQIISKLKSLNFKIYIVTASIAWAVEPAAEIFGLPKESVLGVKTKIKNSYVTDEQDGIITYREGKVQALLEATGNKPPLFSAGNTEGDLALLEASMGLRLVVSSATPEDSNYTTEQRMQRLAESRKWFHHAF